MALAFATSFGRDSQGHVTRGQRMPPTLFNEWDLFTSGTEQHPSCLGA